MNGRSKFNLLMASLLAGVLAITGCATKTTVESRKNERMAAYQALSPEMKSAVDQGTLKAGMNMDAVYISWGKPSQVTTGGDQNGERTNWIYQGGYMQETRYWGGYRMHYGYTPLIYTRATVTFVNGVVQVWQTYPSPE